MKILECEELARDYPPTFLEWVSSSLCGNMAMELNFSDSKLLKWKTNNFLKT